MQKKDISFTENDIRPKNLVRDQETAIASDIKKLLSKKDDFVDITCPACGSRERTPRFEKNGFSYVTCAECETFYLTPRPSSEMIADFLKYSENYTFWSKYIFPASSDARREKIFVPRVDRLLEICEKYSVSREALLEVGAGFGFFCEELNRRKSFKRVVGIEPSPTLAEACRKKGIEIIELPVEKVSGPEAIFDVVVNFEVIEHLFSPKDFLLSVVKFLKPRGLFIITCPNGKGFDIETLGVLSTSVDHEHINYFNPRSLGELLEKCGFEVLESMTPGRLDAELVHNQIIEGKFSVSNQPFLKTVLEDRFGELGLPFQNFLSAHGLSSNMWLVARKK